VVNNASAVARVPIAETDMRRFDLMHQINTRGTFMVSKYAIPHLEKAQNPHILMNSPPLDLQEKWFSGSTAYSIAKYGMSLVVLGLAGEPARPQVPNMNLVCTKNSIRRRRRERGKLAT
jgi:citronellol/citronellal dehydrogenase